MYINYAKRIRPTDWYGGIKFDVVNGRLHLKDLSESDQDKFWTIFNERVMAEYTSSHKTAPTDKIEII